MNNSTRSRVLMLAAALASALLLGPAITRADDKALTTERIEQSIGRERDEEGNWVDASHRYIGNKADDLAIYLDSFFGAPIEDLESADSTVRFVTRFQWDDDRGDDIKFRLRGKVDLPRINERLSLVFNAEDEDYRGDYNARGEKDNVAGLQFKTGETRRTRFDFTLGVESGLNLRPGVRYRFKDELGERSRFRYTGRAYYSDKDRFHTTHQFDLDYLTGETSLVRWSTKLRRGQRSEGTEWRSLLSWSYGYSIDSAVAVVLGLTGVTDPDIPDDLEENPDDYLPFPDDDGSLITNYGLILKFRNRLYKDWLFIEFEPGYTERQRHHYEERHGVYFGRINFEILFNRGREDERKKPAESVAQANFL